MMPQTLSKPHTAFTIEKRCNLSFQELLKEYIEPSLPVVITDATRNWKSIGKLTPEYFRKNYADVSKTVNGKNYRMADVVDLILEGNIKNKAPYPYSFNIEKTFPELLPDFMPELIYGKSDRVNHALLPKFLLSQTTPYELFLGGKGASFPVLHVDALNLHTQITQIYGSKDFFLYPPEQLPYMYPREDNPKFSQVNIFNPDFDKFPLFRNADALKVTVEEGETIVFPTGWWHTTQINEPCISFGRIQLNAANWDVFISDNYQILKKRFSFMASSVLAYGKVAGALMNIQEKSHQ